MKPRLLATGIAVIAFALAGPLAPAWGVTNLLTNPGFEDVDTDGFFGDSWGVFGNAEFNDLFGGNPHASLFGDFAGNWGGFFQQGISGTPGTTYQFDLLNVRIESSWDADLLFGLEYYDADDATKIGETIVVIEAAARIANGTIDGNVLSMQGTAVAGTVFVRPIVRFENVNAGYAGQSQAGVFVFDTFLTVAPAPGDEYLKNPAFDDLNTDGAFGDYWGKYGNADFNEFFGAGNAHASFFADLIGNTGAVYQQAILGTPGNKYQFDLLNVRIETDFDADLYFGLEYYGADDYTKLGETVVPIDTSTTGDGLSFSMVGTAVAGTVYVRPIVWFDNVGHDGGTLRDAFVFEASLSEPAPGVNLIYNPGFLDLDTNAAYGDGWGNYWNTDFNDFWGGNPHASFYGDFAGNSGGIYQLGIPGLAGTTYQFDLLDTRIEENWDADLLFGIEYYAADDATKLGETVVLIDTDARIANGSVDGNVFSVQGTAVVGTMLVRPIVKFENVNPTYAAQSQACAFVFNTFMGVAPAPGQQYLKNPGFDDVNADGNFGDYWGSFGNVGFDEFFGPGNPHASLYADTVGNTGALYQQAVLGMPGQQYRFDLVDVRIEANFDADLFFGLEYYPDDDFTKLGETIVQVDTSTTGDGLSFSVIGTMVPGTKYVRPVVFFDNVGSTGGTDRNAFIFAASLSEILPGDYSGDGNVDLDDYAFFPGCMTGPGGGPVAGECNIFDFEPDNDVDLADFAAFQGAMQE